MTEIKGVNTVQKLPAESSEKQDGAVQSIHKGHFQSRDTLSSRPDVMAAVRWELKKLSREERGFCGGWRAWSRKQSKRLKLSFTLKAGN